MITVLQGATRLPDIWLLLVFSNEGCDNVRNKREKM
jgi:hypothetical protein